MWPCQVVYETEKMGIYIRGTKNQTPKSDSIREHIKDIFGGGCEHAHFINRRMAENGFAPPP